MNQDRKRKREVEKEKFCGNERKRKENATKNVIMDFLRCFCHFFLSSFSFSFNESLIIIFFRFLSYYLFFFFCLRSYMISGFNGTAIHFWLYLGSLPSLHRLETSVIERSVPWRLTCPISTGIRGEGGLNGGGHVGPAARPTALASLLCTTQL